MATCALESEDPACCGSQGGLRNRAEYPHKGKMRKTGVNEPSPSGDREGSVLGSRQGAGKQEGEQPSGEGMLLGEV